MIARRRERIGQPAKYAAPIVMYGGGLACINCAAWTIRPPNAWPML